MAETDRKMDTLSYKTASAKPAEVERKWYVVDAENQVVGRLASKVATILRGKHKPDYTPHVDGGDFVIVVNADKIRFSGKKETEKVYFHYTGYPGGGRYAAPKDVRKNKPEFIVETAVKGMLPKTKLGRQMIKHLKVYAGPTHEHQAQQPEVLSI